MGKKQMNCRLRTLDCSNCYEHPGSKYCERMCSWWEPVEKTQQVIQEAMKAKVELWK